MEECSLGLMYLGFVCLGLECSSNYPFLWGLVGNVPKSLSKEEKQTAESSWFQLWDTFQDRVEEKKIPAPNASLNQKHWAAERNENFSTTRSFIKEI